MSEAPDKTTVTTRELYEALGWKRSAFYAAVERGRVPYADVPVSPARRQWSTRLAAKVLRAEGRAVPEGWLPARGAKRKGARS